VASAQATSAAGSSAASSTSGYVAFSLTLPASGATPASSPAPAPNSEESAAEQIGVYLANKFTTTINATQAQCAPSCPYARMAHVKTHGCLTAQLTLLNNTPAAFQFGLFDPVAQQNVKTFNAIVRFSNGRGNGFVPGAPTADDSGSDVRGMAVKVFGVQGSKLMQPNAETMDFLAVTSETNFLSATSQAQPFFDAVGENTTAALLGFGLLHPIIMTRMIEFAGTGSGYELTQHTFWPIAPLSFNGVAAKFRFAVCASNAATSPLDTTTPNYLAANLQTYLLTQAQSACWTLSAQLYVDETSTPIEDTSIQWQAPWVDLATLSIASQDAWSSASKQKMCEDISFNPWQVHALNAPMGDVQVIRKTVYSQEALVRHSWMQQSLSDWTTATLQQFAGSGVSITTASISGNSTAQAGNNRGAAGVTLKSTASQSMLLSVASLFCVLLACF